MKHHDPLLRATSVKRFKSLPVLREMLFYSSALAFAPDGGSMSRLNRRRMVRIPNRIALPILSALLSSVTASGDVLHVPAEYPTIQSGIDASSAGDSVIVAGGTYFENLVIPHRLVLRGSEGALLTAIDGQGKGTAIFIRNAAEGTAVGGFSVRNGFAETTAGGIFAEYCGVTIQDNLIEHNRALGGVAGLFAVDSSTIDNNLFQHNNLAAGKSVSAVVAQGTITRNTIRHNGDLGDFQIAWFPSGSLVTENVITDNGGVYTALALSGNVIARNNTLANNRAGTAVSIGGPNYEFTNNIVHHPFGEGLSCGEGNQTIRCNDVWGPAGTHYVSECADNAGLDGNFSADPRFCDAPAGDYRLDPASPCAPDNSGGCGLIGALPVCSTAAVPEPAIPRLLLTAQPNPASREVELILDSEQPGAALEIYNSLGRLVEVLEPGNLRSVTWTQPRESGSGIYFARLRGPSPAVVKFVILR